MFVMPLIGIKLKVRYFADGDSSSSSSSSSSGQPIEVIVSPPDSPRSVSSAAGGLVSSVPASPRASPGRPPSPAGRGDQVPRLRLAGRATKETDKAASGSSQHPETRENKDYDFAAVFAAPGEEFIQVNIKRVGPDGKPQVVLHRHHSNKQ
eukprot:GHVT01063530.1.p1 GENE.GHVT01063530.1~~GHVT01063530.1.p1  ORF type:complete len:151 (-),score=52.11 GHVT01063530.1:1562-2014(-)